MTQTDRILARADRYEAAGRHGDAEKLRKLVSEWETMRYV